jgi:hypothetical protein
MSIIDFFDRGWRINPTGAAYIQDDLSYSFNEVGEKSWIGRRDEGRSLGRQ